MRLACSAQKLSGSASERSYIARYLALSIKARFAQSAETSYVLSGISSSTPRAVRARTFHTAHSPHITDRIAIIGCRPVTDKRAKRPKLVHAYMSLLFGSRRAENECARPLLHPSCRRASIPPPSPAAPTAWRISPAPCP